MSVAYLKVEKPIIVLSTKEDFLKNIPKLDEIKDVTLVYAGSNFHHSSKESLIFQKICAQSHKRNIDILYLTNGKVDKRVQIFADTEIIINQVEV